MSKSQASPRIHAASLGEHAPDAAVREGRVEVVLVDEAGRHRHYGRLVKRRHAGAYLVELADDTHKMWWIVAVRIKPPRQVLLGFRHGRRADAMHVFDRVTEATLDEGLDHGD